MKFHSNMPPPRTTTVAKNVGGAVVPLLIAAYALLLAPAALLPSVLGTAIVAMVTHHFAFQLPGIGIALPMLVPPLVAALVALLLGWLMRVPRGIHVIAYVSGVLGTLIGADLTNLHRIAYIGAPVASIGGAGTFDGVFLTGIVAVLLARFQETFEMMCGGRFLPRLGKCLTTNGNCR